MYVSQAVCHLPKKTIFYRMLKKHVRKKKYFQIRRTERKQLLFQPNRKFRIIQRFLPLSSQYLRLYIASIVVINLKTINFFRSGAKLPPSVIKQQQKDQALKNKLTDGTMKKSIGSKLSSNIPKKQTSASKIKKKSIFSPDNTSESDEDEKQKPNLDRRMSSSSSGVRGRGRPRKYPLASPLSSAKSKSEVKLPVITPDRLKKEIKEELSTTTSTSSSSSSCSSDSESSASPVKKSPKNSKSIKENGTDSDIEDTKPSRKSSRMSTNRKSKHLIGTKSETESDVDSNKRSISKSPVKKLQGVATKAKTNHSLKKTENKCLLVEDAAPVQRMCPLSDCDSIGHLRFIYKQNLFLK